MRSIYQQSKHSFSGVNSCDGCLQKQQEIDRLKQEIQALRQKLALHKRKAQTGIFGSSTPSSQLPLKANSKEELVAKHGGAKPGHSGKGRIKHPQDDVDEIRELHPQASCSHCQSSLISKGYRQRSVLDIDPITLRKVLYRLERKACPSCGLEVCAKPGDVLPKSLLSNQLLAEIVDSHYLQGIPLGRVCARWQLNYGSVIAALHRLAKLFTPIMEELKKQYRTSLVRHADETRWRTDGKSGYCWLFTSDRVSLHLYRNTRSGSVVDEVFGKSQELAGYLVVDRYAVYKRVGCKVQYCYAHLLREIRDLQTEFAGVKEVEVYSQVMVELLAQAMHLQSSRPGDQEYEGEAKRIKEEIWQASHQPSSHLAIKHWQDFFVVESEYLYHWVEDRRVPCENNRAERELRPTVIARKVSHGSQSEEGAKTREVLMSVMQSLKKQVPDARQSLKEELDKVAVNSLVRAGQTWFASDSS